MIKWPNLGLFGDFEVCEDGIIDALNKNFFLLDVIVQMGVIDFVPTLPPSPVDGDIYILTTFDNIQAWDGTKWVEITPNPGTIAYVINEDRFYWFDGAYWVILPIIFGDVVGPAASTDNAIARYDGTSGKIIQDSLVSISDAGIMTGSIQTITDQLTALITETNFLSAKYYEITGMTGAVDLIAPASLIGKIQSAITQINNIAAPFGVGSYNRINILVNETVNDVVISDAGNIRTGLSADLNLAPNASVMIMYDSVLNIWRVIGGSGGGGGSGLKNFILNPDADSGIKGYELYKDAAGTYPVDGTGGTSTLTLTTSGTLPLSGKKSFILTKPASNTQGEGFSYDFSIDSVNKARVQQISFDYMVDSGTFVAGSNGVISDFIVYIYDVTNSVLIEPSNIKLLSNSTTLSDRFSATFQTSSNSTSYRLIFHCATVSALAYALKIDNISVSPSVYVYGSPVTNLSDRGVMTIGATTTAPTKGVTSLDKIRSQQIGDQGRFIYEFKNSTGSASGTGEYLVSLPSGVSFDSTKVTFYTASTFDASAGFGSVKISAKQSGQEVQGFGVVVPYDATRFRVFLNHTNAATNIPYADIWGSANLGLGLTPASFSADFMAPIAGYSSSVQMSDGSTPAVVDFVGYPASSQALTTGVTNLPLTSRKDSHGAWTGSTYIIPVAGDYQFSLHMVYSASISNNLKIYVNGTAARRLAVSFSSVIVIGAATVEDLKVGDVVSIRSSEAGCTISGDAQSHLSISRISGPQTIAASETVTARYSSAAGQTFTGGVRAIVNFGTKEKDTHGFVTTGAAWKFKPSIAGEYEVTPLVQFASASWTATAVLSLEIWKNGGSHKSLSIYQVQANLTSMFLPPLTGTTSITLLADEYFDIRVSENEGSRSLEASGGNVYISIKRIGN